MSIRLVIGPSGCGKTKFIISELLDIDLPAHRIWYDIADGDVYPCMQFPYTFVQPEVPAGWGKGYPDGSVVVFDRHSDVLATEAKRIIESQERHQNKQHDPDDEIRIFISVYDRSEVPENIKHLIKHEAIWIGRSLNKKSDKPIAYNLVPVH